VHQVVERSCSHSGCGVADQGTGTNPGWRQGWDEATSGDGAGCGGEEVAGCGEDFRSEARAVGNEVVRLNKVQLIYEGRKWDIIS
jgi:hypothetical protein